jgi:acyl carrier protein
MTTNEILMGLADLFREVFEDQSLILTPEMTSDDIAQWDSMFQVTLAVEIEHRFHVKIRSAEMETMRSVADLIQLIESLLAARDARLLQTPSVMLQHRL